MWPYMVSFAQYYTTIQSLNTVDAADQPIVTISPFSIDEYFNLSYLNKTSPQLYTKVLNSNSSDGAGSSDTTGLSSQRVLQLYKYKTLDGTSVADTFPPYLEGYLVIGGHNDGEQGTSSASEMTVFRSFILFNRQLTDEEIDWVKLNMLHNE